MKRFWQKEWHGILFSSFYKSDSRQLADSEFYSAFYDKFFSKYHSWDELDTSWKEQKCAVASFIKNHIVEHKVQHVLSIGCGLGWIEYNLMNYDLKTLHLEITETSDTPLRWIKKYFSPDTMHIGYFPDCLPDSRKYDLIYCSALDYCMNQTVFINFLRNIKRRLSKGQCMIISASLEDEGLLHKMKVTAKMWVKTILEIARLYHRGQFWGWQRNKRDYHSALESAGFILTRDGYINYDNQPIYWITGY